MGSIAEIVEEDLVFDVNETIFVAVGEHVESSKTTLFWAVQNFAGKRICLLHVHRPSRVAASNRKSFASIFKQHGFKAVEQLQKQKVDELLNSYLLLLSEAGVHADKLWIPADIIEEGIVELIAKHNVRWLVMGAAADKYYSRKMSGLKSKKAVFVSKKAPVYCHIWFVCKGCLIFTRAIGEDRTDRETAPPLLLLDSNVESEQSETLESAYIMRRPRFQDAEEDASESEGELRELASYCSLDSSFSTSDAIAPDTATPQTDEDLQEEPYQRDVICEIDYEFGKAITDANKPKRIIFQEAMKRWKEEDSAMEAKCKSKSFEILCIKEMNRRTELEEVLEKEKVELEKMKKQCEGVVKELQTVQDRNDQLKNQIAQKQGSAKELEDKILSAVELLISFKKQRDEMRVEHRNAMEKVKALRKLVKGEGGSSFDRRILEFSFMEIIEATNEFDPSWKIGEGKYGSVYKGLLRQVQVAIKMLPSYGSQSLLEFQNQVEVVSRVRHPNLVTLMGTCTESRSLVYEYLHNGSLENFLSCRSKTRPLSWETWTRIASEICSALIFLHSNRPCIIHGNLKPSKVLLDSNFVSKINGYGIQHLIPQSQNETNRLSKDNSLHIDPNYSETRKLTPESDVYSFGIILLQFLTSRPASGILRDVKCALENDNFYAVLDHSAGNWPVAQAKQLADLAIRCCEKDHLKRPRLSDILRVLEPMKSPHITSSSSYTASREQRKAPSHFLCPIFQEVMKDPLIATDGFTYEAEAIREWLKSGHDTSPMTNLKLEDCNLLPNHALHQAIQEWQQQW